jgi:hypothetical protein
MPGNIKSRRIKEGISRGMAFKACSPFEAESTSKRSRVKLCRKSSRISSSSSTIYILFLAIIHRAAVDDTFCRIITGPDGK